MLSRICHNRRLTYGRNTLGLCHYGPGQALTRRLLSLGYLTRRRAGWRLRWLLVGVMALGVLQVIAEHGVLPVLNTAVVPAILLTWGLGLLWGGNAVEVRRPQGMAIASRRQLRMVTGVILGIAAANVVALAPNNEAAAVLGSVLATGVVWWVVRAALCRATTPIATPRGRQVIANLQARERAIDDRPSHDLAALA